MPRERNQISNAGLGTARGLQQFLIFLHMDRAEDKRKLKKVRIRSVTEDAKVLTMEKQTVTEVNSVREE